MDAKVDTTLLDEVYGFSRKRGFVSVLQGDEMSKETSSSSSSGIGFCGILTVAFVVLKLVHVIDWSWFWVLSPILIPALGY